MPLNRISSNTFESTWLTSLSAFWWFVVQKLDKWDESWFSAGGCSDHWYLRRFELFSDSGYQLWAEVLSRFTASPVFHKDSWVALPALQGLTGLESSQMKAEQSGKKAQMSRFISSFSLCHLTEWDNVRCRCEANIQLLTYCILKCRKNSFMPEELQPHSDTQGESCECWVQVCKSVFH